MGAWLEVLIGAMAMAVIVTSVATWPSKHNHERIESIAVLTVGCETMIDAANNAINRLRLLVDDNRDVDSAVAELIWARDYVMERTEALDLKIVRPIPFPAETLKKYEPPF